MRDGCDGHRTAARRNVLGSRLFTTRFGPSTLFDRIRWVPEPKAKAGFPPGEILASCLPRITFHRSPITVSPMPDLAARYKFATDLIKDAGTLALDYFHRLGTLTIKQKGEQDMASEADVNVEMLIRNRLQSRFPEDAFLGEETGRTEFSTEQGVWVVDPIDGTQPFINGLAGWCVSIAFVLNGTLEMGLVYGPARGELFQGRRGQPATLNGNRIQVGNAS